MLSSASSLDWKVVSNCLDLSKSLNNLLKDPTLVESPTVSFEVEPVIDDWVFVDYASSYVADYNEDEKSITLIRWPKDPKWSTVDFKHSKKIGIIKIPSTFKNVYTRIYENKYLIIFAEHKDASKRTETVVIFYNITDGKITPEFFFTHTWRLIKVHDQEWKMFVFTNTQPDRIEVQNFVKKDGNYPEIFPKYAEWQKYGLDPDETTSVCKNFSYLQMPSKQLPSFRGIIVLNLNNLKNSKELVYMLWTISQVAFTEKSMYLTVPWDWDKTIVQKFWIEPKINPQQSTQVDWTVLQWWLLASDMKLGVITKKSSWKINQYSLIPFTETFVQNTETALHTTEDNFSNVETHWTSIMLYNKDKIVTVWDRAWWNVAAHWPIELSLKDHNYFQFSSSPLTLIDVNLDSSRLNFDIIEKDKSKSAFRKVSQARYEWEWKVTWKASWNSKTRTLLLPVSILWYTSFEWLKVLQLTAKWAISEVMSRSYWTSPEIIKVWQLQDFSYTITDKLVDIFLTNNSIAKKVFKR